MKHSLNWKLELACLMLFSTLSLASTQDSTATTDKLRPTPMAFLQGHDARVQDVLAQSPGDSLSAKLRQKVKDHINAAFDFEELSRLSLGEHWEARSETERAEFVQVFSGIIEEQNFDNFLRYYREGKIDYQEEKIDSAKATVSALVPLEKGEAVDIIYYLHLVEDQWRVYDLVIEDTSTANGNRRRYARYIKKHSYEKLIQKLNEQLDRLMQQNH